MPETTDNFVEVALPLPPRRTFTYKLPASLSEKVQLGSRVLVPFGKRMMTGYAVAFHESLDPELGIEESSVKDVAELQDEFPLVNEEILALTKWTADYYAASWGELLKASLPAGINSAVESIVEITESGRDQFRHITNLKQVRIALFYRRKRSFGEFGKFHIKCLELLLLDMQHYFQQPDLPKL